MEKNFEIINFLIENGGLPKDMTWFEVGEKFGLKPSDTIRGEVDKKYYREAVSKKANDIWRKYLKNKNKYELVRYKEDKDGEVISKEFKKAYKDFNINTEDFEIEKISKSNFGIEWVTYRKNIDLEKKIEKLKEIFSSGINKIDAVKPKEKEDKVLLVYTSDKHYGAYVDENIATYKNSIDNRMKRVFTYISKIVNRIGNFSEIYVFDLGDALDGFEGKTTRGLNKQSSHYLPQNLDNVGQYEKFFEEHKDFFGNLYQSGFADKYYFIGVANSNHGGDFDYMAFRLLETYLNLAMPEIKTFITRKFINHLQIGKHTIIYTHGSDKENTRKPQPLYLDTKTNLFYLDYIKINNIETPYITVVAGDMHRASVNYGSHIRYRKVLSQFGETRWMQDNFGHTDAGISFDVIYPDDKTIFAIDEMFEQEIKNTKTIFK